MKPRNELHPGYAVPHKPGQPRRAHQPQKPVIAQLPVQMKAPPAAPSVYRPQPAQAKVAQAVQPKMGSTPRLQKAPVAPPVYRPKPALTVMQGRAAALQSSHPVALPARTNFWRDVLQPKFEFNGGGFTIGRSSSEIRAEELREQGYTRRQIRTTLASERRQEQKQRAARAKKKTQSCKATLTIGSTSYDGSTGKNAGHAEMHALHLYVSSFDTVSDAADDFRRRRARRVSCPSRPVCLKCGSVLKALGFSLAAGTTWGEDKMGSTEWGCSLKVREFLREFDLDYESFLRL